MRLFKKKGREESIPRVAHPSTLFQLYPRRVPYLLFQLTAKKTLQRIVKDRISPSTDESFN